jgi:hypothetical protein
MYQVKSVILLVRNLKLKFRRIDNQLQSNVSALNNLRMCEIIIFLAHNSKPYDIYVCVLQTSLVCSQARV